MKRILFLLLLLVRPVTAQLPDTTNIQSDRQLRQRLSFAIARAREVQAAAIALEGHIKVTYDAVHARIVRDSLRALGGVVTPPPPPPPSGSGTNVSPFFMSTETGCGTDTNVLLCDDFEDGDWYSDHCDATGNAGKTDPDARADGWCGTIYVLPIVNGAADCSGNIGAFGRCAATSGFINGWKGSGFQAEHSMAPAGAEYQEIYVRYYYRHSVGFTYSSSKLLTFNRCCNTGGIYWSNFGMNPGYNTQTQTQTRLTFTNNLLDQDPAPPNTQIFDQNQGANSLDLDQWQGQWVYIEIRIKLNTPGASDGVLQMWAKGCGPTLPGNCTGTPPLAMSHTAVNWGKIAGTGGANGQGGIGSVWWENWSSPGVFGQQWYDQIKVSKAPIGFKN